MGDPGQGAHGLLLAAGAGSRMGMPKALVRDEDGEPWLVRGVRTLAEGGCAAVTVVLGAAVDDAARLLGGSDEAPEAGVGGADIEIVVAEDWAQGMSASLRAGLGALATTGAEAAVVTLVDLPDVSAAVVARVLAESPDAATLRRAAYRGRPGHPVVIGRDHWPALLAEVEGDAGARGYLASRHVELVECGDLATGVDVDERPTSRSNHGPTGG